MEMSIVLTGYTELHNAMSLVHTNHQPITRS